MRWRENLAKALYDLGKLTFAALVIGQLVTPQGLQPFVFVLGVAFTALAFVIAVIVDDIYWRQSNYPPRFDRTRRLKRAWYGGGTHE